MKRITLTIYTFLLIGLTTQLLAQTDQDAAMKAWMSYMTPGDVHKMLAKDDGDWNEEITLWMAPGAPPTKSTATASNKMIMGGRYQESKHTGNFMGMPFEGYSLVGYDNAKKVFVSSWVDNMGTGIMHMEGKWDDKTKTIHFTGKTTDPSTGKDVAVRETFTWIDNTKQKMEMFMTQDGKEFKSMEIIFTRK
ncbi:MAG: DUF1579 domain-containing protein [Chitinophagaceae bacterium]|nr:DUF1579 domain-containing protein [Chitinophagaceae bacterium]